MANLTSQAIVICFIFQKKFEIPENWFLTSGQYCKSSLFTSININGLEKMINKL